MESSKSVKGVDKLLHTLPEEHRYWHKFGIITKFDYERYYDYVDEMYFGNVYMIVTDNDEKYRIGITLKKVYGDIKFYVGMHSISLFDISDMKSFGYEKNARFHVYDCESNDFSLWCGEVEAEIL